MPAPDAPAETRVGEDLYRLLYCSKISRTKTADDVKGDIDAILLRSRHDNPPSGITGVLITDHRMYAQVIEGPDWLVKNLIGHIACDNRHRDVSVVSHQKSSRRIFEEWSMAFIATDRALEQEAILFPRNDEQHDILAISSFCASLRRHLLENAM